MLDIIGHMGYILIAIGLMLLSKRIKEGWIFRFLGNAIWVILGLKMGMTSIWIWGAYFTLVDLKGYFGWRNQ